MAEYSASVSGYDASVSGYETSVSGYEASVSGYDASQHVKIHICVILSHDATMSLKTG